MKKFMLIVQGEGRGHLTQAIALCEMLQTSNQEVVAVMVGTSSKHNIPSFFKERVQTQIVPFESPSLAYHPTKKCLSISKTILNSVGRLPNYLQSISQIEQTIKTTQPDVIVNFYDVLGGFHHFLSKYLWQTSKPMICIAHQYLLLHKGFQYPEKYSFLDRLLVNLNTQITALGADKQLALSFRPMPNDDTRKITVVPPLLRREVYDLSDEFTENEGYILVYMTQSSMAQELINWHANHTEVEIHCFSDRPQDQEVVKQSENLYFHQINGKKFLEMMKRSRGVVCTAGFESVCEAMLLQKPVKMIPVPKHFEQTCNSIDGKLAGAGIVGQRFDLDDFMSFLDSHHPIIQAKEWFSKANELFFSNLVGKPQLFEMT